MYKVGDKVKLIRDVNVSLGICLIKEKLDSTNMVGEVLKIVSCSRKLECPYADGLCPGRMILGFKNREWDSNKVIIGPFCWTLSNSDATWLLKKVGESKKEDVEVHKEGTRVEFLEM